MSRSFYKYKDIRKLNNVSSSNDIFAGTIITATSDMAKAMYQYYGPVVTYGDNPDKDIDVRTISSAIKGLVSEWETDIKDIKNYILIRNIIDDISKSDKIKNIYLKRNAYEIWNAIKILVEMGVYVVDIDDGISEHIDDLKTIFERLKDDTSREKAFYNPRVDKFYDGINKSWDKETINQKLKANENSDEEYRDLKDDIYLFGFYFVTALQERVFDILESAGYNLHFMLCYNNTYPYPNEVWKKTFNINDDIHIEDIDDTNFSLANDYGEFLNGNITESLSVTLHKHNSDIDFVKYVEDAQNNVETVFSPNVRACEELIRGYHPEYVQKKKLLAYPIGQYLYNLHSCINTSSDKVSIDVSYNNILRCFASGCLNTMYEIFDEEGKVISTEEINGKQFLYEMSVLKPFFSRCHTFSDWFDIFKSLCDSIKLKELFDSDREDEADINKAYESLKNPFNYIAALKIPIESLKKIATLIDLVREDLMLLIWEDKEDDKNHTLGDYYEALSTVINRHGVILCKPSAGVNGGKSFEEQPDAACVGAEQPDAEIRNFIIDSLNDEDANNIPCNLESIKDAIMFLLSEKNTEYESFETHNVYSRGKIKPLTLVEAEMLNNYGQKVHLVWADEYALPGSPTKLPWPLTMEVFDEIRAKLLVENSELSKRQIKYIDAALNVIKNRPLANRYLFYTFLGLTNKDNSIDLSIEWLADDGAKEIAVSPYVSMLDLKVETTNCKKEYSFANGSHGECDKTSIIDPIDETVNDSKEDEETCENLEDKKRVEIIAANAPDLAIMDYDLCPYRYLLSYEYNDGPSYVTDFHYSFLIAKLTAAISLKTECKMQDIVDTISRIFKYKSKAEREDAKKYTPRCVETINKHFENKKGEPIWNLTVGGENIWKEKPEYALLPHYLDYNLMNLVVEKRIEEIIENHDLKKEASQYKLDTDGLNIQKCTFCPYENVCINRYYKYPEYNPNIENEYVE